MEVKKTNILSVTITKEELVKKLGFDNYKIDALFDNYNGTFELRLIQEKDGQEK